MISSSAVLSTRLRIFSTRAMTVSLITDSPTAADIQVTDSVRHTVGKRYPGDDSAGYDGVGRKAISSRQVWNPRLARRGMFNVSFSEKKHRDPQDLTPLTARNGQPIVRLESACLGCGR